MRFSTFTSIRLFAAVVTTATLMTASAVHAAYSNGFDALRAELLARANALTGSVDKVEQKQGKACLKAIAALDKSTSLPGDVKAAGKVAKSLAKSFPNEFGTADVELDLSDVLEGSFSNLTPVVQGVLDDLQTEINALTAGSAKTSAQASHDAAVQLLTQSGEAADFSSMAKTISSALKNLIKGFKTVDKANNSDGGGGGGKGLSCKIDGAKFSALGATAIYVGATGQFTVTGATAQKGVNISAVDVIGAGTYPAGAGTGVIDIAGGTTHGSGVTGTIYIKTLNLAQQKASGTFSFSATQTTPSLDPSSERKVTTGSFDISTIIQFP